MNDPQRSQRQLALSLNVTFNVPEQASLDCLDKWLTVLEIPAAPRQTANHAEAWLWRALLLAREWLQAGRIPVFDFPDIIYMVPDPKVPARWQATVQLVHVDHIPHALYCDVLNNALRLCAWAAARKPDAQARAAAFAMMENFASEKLKKSIGAGDSTMPVLAVAHRMGIPFLHLGAGVFQLGWGSRARRLDRSVTGADSAIGAKLCQNKVLTAALLRAAGLPAPVHRAVTTADEALAASRQIGWPVVVKPAARDGGAGVTIDVADEAALRAAFATAAAYGATIVERQAAGDCHRVFVAHGALLFALRRRPMGIYGDGVQTVAALTAAEVATQQNRPPWKRSHISPLDAEAKDAITKAGFSPETVPASGIYVPLRFHESPACAGLSEDVGAVHPANITAALHAAELLGLQVAGVDFITTDFTKPWHQTGAIINEVNFSPVLGASDISRRAIPTFLAGLLGGNGRIPVHIYAGGDAAWRAAVQHWRRLTEAGEAAFLTSSVKTFSPCGTEWPMPFTSIAPRAHALVLSPKPGAIILAARPEDLNHSPLPFDTVDTFTKVNMEPVSPRRECPASQIRHPESARPGQMSQTPPPSLRGGEAAEAIHRS